MDKQFITVENTTYIDKHGMKWTGNNQYTILTIQMAMDHFYQQQMLRLKERALMRQQIKNASRAPLSGAVCPSSGRGCKNGLQGL